MVFYFKCSDPKFIIFMGRDKFENEQLLKFAFPEDLWFHVNSLSSAHVYLRPVDLRNSPEIPEIVFAEISQLVKHNSIEGCKANTVDIVYCKYLNLLKRKDMEPGAVSYISEKENKYIRDVRLNKEIHKRIEKTREERDVDLKALREDRDREEAKLKAAEKKNSAAREKIDLIQKEKNDVNYVDFQKNKLLLQSNKTTNEHLEDDFM